MKRKKKKTVKKRSAKRNPKRNPSVHLPLTKDEYRAITDFISGRYTSGDYLLDAYNEKTGNWDMEIVAKALIATPGDGGNWGTVPLAGGSLNRKIGELFYLIETEPEKYLSMDMQMELYDASPK